MKEIRNFRGEIVQAKSVPDEYLWLLPREAKYTILGIFLLVDFVLTQVVTLRLHFSDIRVRTLLHLLLDSVTLGFLLLYWSIYQSWELLRLCRKVMENFHCGRNCTYHHFFHSSIPSGKG